MTGYSKLVQIGSMRVSGVIFLESGNSLQNDDLQLDEGEVIEIGLPLLFDLQQDLPQNISQVA